MGQCNDAYSAIVVASKLAEVFGTDVNGLPLSLDLSWLEQKVGAGESLGAERELLGGSGAGVEPGRKNLGSALAQHSRALPFQHAGRWRPATRQRAQQHSALLVCVGGRSPAAAWPPPPSLPFLPLPQAVVILCTLLHLGIKNIRIGPHAPAFLTPEALQVVVDTFDLKLADLKNPKADVEAMMANA